nr:hypothetical protein [Mesorhizobium loti]
MTPLALKAIRRLFELSASRRQPICRHFMKEVGMHQFAVPASEFIQGGNTSFLAGRVGVQGRNP